MRNKKHNPDIYMVDVFYEKNKKRNKPENEDSKNVRHFKFALKLVIIVAAIFLAGTFMPGNFIKPAASNEGETVLINEAPDAEPVADDGSVPDEEIWRDNISPVNIENKIYLVWDDRSSGEYILTDKTGEAGIKIPAGANVLAPIWFELQATADGKGIDFAASDVSTHAFDYVELCHKKGIEVWGTIHCVEKYELSELIMTDAQQQQLLIDQINLWIAAYNLDGINLDFEYMNPDHKQLYNNFAANLRSAMAEDKTLSACVTVKLLGDTDSNYWQSYDRGGLAEAVDYITVMTYDEHKASTKRPVASIEWVDLHIRRLLEEIPSEKLVMGMPLHGVDYRAEVVDAQTLTVNPLWKNSGHLAVTYLIDKMLETGVYTASKDNVFVVDYWINKGGWNAELGVTEYSFVDTDGIQHTMWADDENSIYQKTRLAYDYNLAGVAIWKLNIGTESIFEAVARADGN